MFIGYKKQTNRQANYIYRLQKWGYCRENDFELNTPGYKIMTGAILTTLALFYFYCIIPQTFVFIEAPGVEGRGGSRAINGKRFFIKRGFKI